MAHENTETHSYHTLPFPRISCVILNYNDAATVEKLVRKICHYTVFRYIILVDNCSSDNSLTDLKKLSEELNQKPELEFNQKPEMEFNQKLKKEFNQKSKKIIILSAKKNGGYGAGNNIGIRYSHDILHMDYVLIANPDVDFSEQLIIKLCRMFKHHPELGTVSACMNDPVFGRQRNGWPLSDFWHELARCGPLCRRIFNPFLEYPKRYFQGKKAVYVDAVHGSLLMVDAKKMIKCGGYDEGLFLYQEEAILGSRMKNAGYRTALLLTDSYDHLHSTSISRTYHNAWERQKLRNKSCIYYYEKYLKINHMQKISAAVFFEIIHLEIWFCRKVLGMHL